MKTSLIVSVAVICIALTACSTKRYPMEAQLSEQEIAFMDCRDLHREYLRGQNLRLQVADTARTDWRSVAGFMGDWGIGNYMARSEAESALEHRMTSIRLAQQEKGCEVDYGVPGYAPVSQGGGA